MNIFDDISKMLPLFADGAIAQLKHPYTINAAAVIGLLQGLKYNGNFKRGVTAGLATVLVFMTANGLYNVVINFDSKKDI